MAASMKPTAAGTSSASHGTLRELVTDSGFGR